MPHRPFDFSHIKLNVFGQKMESEEMLYLGRLPESQYQPYSSSSNESESDRHSLINNTTQADDRQKLTASVLSSILLFLSQWM